MRQWFDRFAERTARQVARPWFFLASIALHLVWALNGGLFLNIVSSITFLVAVLLMNTEARTDKALHAKLDALLRGMAENLDNTDGLDESGLCARELRDIAGVEMIES